MSESDRRARSNGPMALAMAIAGFLSMLSGCGVVNVVDPTKAEAFQDFDFEDMEPGSTPEGWEISSSNVPVGGGRADDLAVPVHSATVDDAVAHAGKRSLRFGAPADAPGTLYGFVKHCATPDAGSRVLDLRVAVRSDADIVNVSLDSSLSSTSTGLARGDWAEHRLLFVRPGDGEVCVNIQTSGRGSVWIDDLRVTAVELDANADRAQVPIQNQDFEEPAADGAPAHWSPGPAPPGQTVETRSVELDDGTRAMRFSTTATAAERRPSVSQCVAPGDASLVHVRGWLRPEPPDEQADVIGFLASLSLTASKIPASVIERLSQLDRAEAEPEVKRLVAELARDRTTPVINTAQVSVPESRPESKWTEAEMIVVVPPETAEICLSAAPAAGGAVVVDNLDVRALDL